MSLVPHALTNVENFKLHLDPDMDGRDDVLIESLINGFSTYAQSSWACNREFVKKVRNEFVSGPTCRIFVKAPPIWDTPDLEVWDDVDREFTDTDRRLTNYSDYDVDWDSGIIRSPYSSFSQGIKNLKIIYMGGLFDENGDRPDDLRTACEMQCSWWFKRRDNYGMRQADGALGTTQYFSPTEILPIVKQILLSNRRFHY